MLLGALAVSVVVLIATSAGQAASSAPPLAARDLAAIYFSNALTRAEILTYVGRVEHDYKIDEGRVVAVRPNAIDLLERDGTRQTIAIGQQTVVSGIGRLFAASIPRGTRVVAVREGSGPATQLRPSASARILGRVFFGAALVRAQVLTYQAKTLHDNRIDEGRIVKVAPGASLTLLERDGTKQTIAVTPATVVSFGGQPVDQSALTKGLTAITIREGDGPAAEIMLAAGLGVGRP